jgi:hypothetical protein
MKSLAIWFCWSTCPAFGSFYNYLWVKITCLSLWPCMLISHALFGDSAWGIFVCWAYTILWLHSFIDYFEMRLWGQHNEMHVPMWPSLYFNSIIHVFNGPLYISTRIPERDIMRELFKYRTCLLIGLYVVAVPTNEIGLHIIQLRVCWSWQVFNMGHFNLA